MNRYAGYALAIIASLIVGYFAGREHLKYEMRSALQAAAAGIQEGISSAFGGRDTARQRTEKSKAESTLKQEQQNPIEKAYIAEHLELYDLAANYTDSVLDGKVPGVLFKIRNNGDRTLNRIEVAVYFRDAEGKVVAEESYLPVRVSQYSLSDNKPLKPGYIWQMERGKFFAAKKVPSEWKEGSADASISDVKFAE